MPPGPGKTNGKACVNRHANTFSFITVVDDTGARFPHGISITAVQDTNNGIVFAVSRPSAVGATKLKARIKAPAGGPLRGVGPDSGDLSITLSDPTVPVNDMPVDYVDDDLTP
jgi:hypothetical protein